MLQTDAFIFCLPRELLWTLSLQSASVLNRNHCHGTLQNYYPIFPFIKLKKVGIIIFLSKHMALATFNRKQRHEIIIKRRTLVSLKWEGGECANCQHLQPISFFYLLQCPPLPYAQSKLLGEKKKKKNQPVTVPWLNPEQSFWLAQQ